MPDKGASRYGLNSTLDLIRKLATRSRHDPDRSRPVLIVTGPPGSGKTTLLDELARLLRGNVPNAWIDFAAPGADSRDTLYKVAVQLTRARSRYRTLSLPRLITAEIAITEPLGAVNTTLERAAAKATIDRALLKYRKVDKLLDFLAKTTPDLFNGVLGGIPGGRVAWRYLPRLTLRALAKIRWGRRLVLGKGLDWYRHQDQGLVDDPLDVLVDLNLDNRPGAAGRSRVEEVMWAALLADLRANFRGWRSRWWSINGFLLADNVDAAAGLGLVDRLVAIRGLYAANGPDPLTVVATSRTNPPSANSDRNVVGMGDLTRDDVRAMARKLPSGIYRRVADDVYRFARGHPGSTAILLDAFAERPDAGLPAALPDVEDRLRDQFLLGRDKKTVIDLVTIAAARDIGQASQLATASDLLTGPRGPANPVFTDDLWTRDSRNRTVLVPVLRHLLLRRLASRSDGATWSAVHEWLRTDAKETGDEAGELYHALALGEVGSVTRRLTDRLADTDVDDWLRLLYAVTCAPRDRVASVDDVNAHAKNPVAGLVTGLWLAGDPVNSALWDTVQPWIHNGFNGIPHCRDAMRMAAERRRWDASTGFQESPAAPPLPVRNTGDDVPAGPFRPRKPRWPAVTYCGTGLAAIGIASWLITGPWFHGPRDVIFDFGGERVGVTDGSFVFDPRLESIERLIRAENDTVTSGGRFVTVALLTPMTSSPGSGISIDRIRSELEGAYIAQHTANRERTNPPIRLVLANEGSREQAWSPVVDRLVDMTGAPDRLVTVIGMGVSSQETADAARRLSEHNIPMIGAVITADNLNSDAIGLGGPIPGLFRVNLSVADEFSVIADFLDDSRKNLRTATLVSDKNSSDLYTSAMRDDFTGGALAQYWANGDRKEQPYVGTPGTPGIGAQFSLIAQNLCGVDPPDLYFYAGRSELLPDFVTGLRGRSCARDRTITVVTGSDASSLPAILDKPDEFDAPVSVIYPLLADPEQLSDPESNPDIDQYRRFERAFVEENGFDRADLDDGWAIMTHDAMLAARQGIQRVTGQSQDLPGRGDIRNVLRLFNSPTTAVRGAGGTFTFDQDNGNVVGRRIPVVELRPDGSRIPLGTFDQPN